MDDWLFVNCIFNGVQFKAMYRISRSTFEIIFQRLAAESKFFRDAVDACGQPGIAPYCKIMMAIKALAYGCTPTSWRDYFQMSETICKDSVDNFAKLMRKLFYISHLQMT